MIITEIQSNGRDHLDGQSTVIVSFPNLKKKIKVEEGLLFSKIGFSMGFISIIFQTGVKYESDFVPKLKVIYIQRL